MFSLRAPKWKNVVIIFCLIVAGHLVTTCARLLSFSGGQCVPAPVSNYYVCTDGKCQLEGTVWNYVHSFNYCSNLETSDPADIPKPRLDAIFAQHEIARPTGTYIVKLPVRCFDDESKRNPPSGYVEVMSGSPPTTLSAEEKWNLRCRDWSRVEKLSEREDLDLISAELNKWKSSRLKRYYPSIIVSGALVLLFVLILALRAIFRKLVSKLSRR